MKVYIKLIPFLFLTFSWIFPFFVVGSLIPFDWFCHDTINIYLLRELTKKKKNNFLYMHIYTILILVTAKIKNNTIMMETYITNEKLTCLGNVGI